MANIPLEDNFTDILSKAQRGLKWSEADLAQRAGVPVAELGRVKSGEVIDGALTRLAAALQLGPDALLASAKKAWSPQPVSLDGLAQFNTPWEDMTVNAYLVWDAQTQEAAVFDTGADCGPIVREVKFKGLTVKSILLTHTHPDHIADLTRLRRETGAKAWVSKLEAISGAETFAEGHTFALGRLSIASRLTTGHSVGGVTYVIQGLARPVAVVGDAIFAGSMGGGLVSYADALSNNRSKILTLPDDTVLCPGHGPLTTVGEQKQHNPFYPELQRR
jgi:hydroxyacylglutathione hydrolase